MTEQNGKSTPVGASADTELGRVLVEQNLATNEELEEARKGYAASREDISGQTFADYLVNRQVVTPKQMERVRVTLDEARKRQQIPGYQILGKLGAGAMATVFKARQLSLDRVVAIKVLPRQLSENADYVERFYREGQAAAKLNHPNIVQAIDVGEAGGYHYFVMEYVEGRSLYDDIEGGKRLAEPEALRIGIEIARALEHAHNQGLIHRDVKPKNIMITRDGTAKLADMGLARAARDTAAAQAEAGKAFGTPYYISPEQIRGELDIDFRADIYSLGATLYHMVTGRVPFNGPTPAAVMHKHLKEPLTPPDHINTELSSGVGEVVEVMMAKDRNRRYASTGDLLMDLESIARGEPPLQARERIDANVLTGLAEADEAGETRETEAVADTSSNARLYIVLLAAALTLSVLINIVLLVT